MEEHGEKRSRWRRHDSSRSLTASSSSRPKPGRPSRMEPGSTPTDARGGGRRSRQRAPSPLELGGVQGQTVRLASRSVERTEQVRQRTAQVNTRIHSLDVRMSNLQSKMARTAEAQERRVQDLQKYMEDLSRQSESWVSAPSTAQTPRV